MDDPVIAEALQDVFAGDGFRVYTNPDVIGCEVAGALKNVMAIASGMADGLGTGDNTRAAVITAASPSSRLGCAMEASRSPSPGSPAWVTSSPPASRRTAATATSASSSAAAAPSTRSSTR